MPAQYISGGGTSGPTFEDVPAGKKVKVYLLTQESRDKMDPTNAEASFKADLRFEGTTTQGGTTIAFQIPENYNGVDLYPFMLIILDEALNEADLTGTNHFGFFSLAPNVAQIALGFIDDNEDLGSFKASFEGGTVDVDIVDLKVMSYKMLPQVDN